jgi:hypothetical protein
MVKVVALDLSEPVRVDARRRDDIITELGRQAGEDVITTALEQLAVLLSSIDAAVNTGDLDQANHLSQLLSRLAWQLGLVSLATVAMDLGLCAEQLHRPAIQAVHARLMRVGNLSLTRIWEPQPTVG